MQNIAFYEFLRNPNHGLKHPQTTLLIIIIYLFLLIKTAGGNLIVKLTWIGQWMAMRRPNHGSCALIDKQFYFSWSRNWPGSNLLMGPWEIIDGFLFSFLSEIDPTSGFIL